MTSAAERALIAPPTDFPVCLYAKTTVAIGAIATPDADDLQNHFDCPIQIEEVRLLFFLNYVLSGAGSAAEGSTLAGLVRMQLKMGRIDLTNGFVPSWLLGPRLQVATELTTGQVVLGGNQTLWDYQRWKLPVPMIVPAGATLLPTFYYLLPDGTISLTRSGNSPITVHVALIGRSLPRGKMPKRIRVPYASAFIANTATGGQQSQDDQLVNKFDVPLHVQWLTGRMAAQPTAPGVKEAWASVEDARSVTNVGSGTYNLMIKDNAGYSIVGTMTNFFDVFPRDRKGLVVNRVLAPRGWYVAFFEDKPTVSQNLPMIGMIGWREEELSL